jgi:hypothetical protein
VQLEETDFEDTEWIELAQDGIQIQVFVMWTMDLRVARNRVSSSVE